MPKKVLFLYKGFPEKINQLMTKNINGVFVREGTSIVGIDLDVFNLQLRGELVKNYALREFEVEQEKFTYIIKKMPLLGARILEIEITKTNQLPMEIMDVLNTAIEQQEQGIDQLLVAINECWELGHDVKSVEFFWNGNRIHRLLKTQKDFYFICI